MRRYPLAHLLLTAFTVHVLVELAEATVLPPIGTTNLYVSSHATNEVHCYAADGRFLFKFRHEELIGPRGLAFGLENELHVASEGTDQVLVFTVDGTYLRGFTGGGLDQPTSLAFGPDEELYVSSFATDEVLVFRDGVFERALAAAGLDGPNCIALGTAGDFYVASQLTDEVFHFDAGGAATGSFTGGGLSSPMGIAILDGEVFVTGGASHSVVVFDLAGQHLRTIQGSVAETVLNTPQGIAFASDGSFAVSSYATGRVGLYTREGVLLRPFEDSGVRVARSVAFVGEPRERAFLRGDLSTNGQLDIADAIRILLELFVFLPCDPCSDEGDADDNGLLQLTDAVYVLSYLFLDGPAPAAPFPEAGPDPTPDDLPCLGGKRCSG